MTGVDEPTDEHSLPADATQRPAAGRPRRLRTPAGTPATHLAVGTIRARATSEADATAGTTALSRAGLRSSHSAAPAFGGAVGGGVAAAMQAREVAAARGFVLLAAILAIGVGATLPFVDGDPFALRLLIATVSAAGVGFGYTAWVLARRPERFGLAASLILTLSATFGGTAGVYFFGFYSPAPLATAMGLFFFGLSRHRSVAIATWIATTVIHTAMMSLIAAGVTADRGVVHMFVPGEHSVVALIVLTQVVFALTFFIARAVHKAMEDAAGALAESTRAIAHREALLEEARRELEEALEVGGPGRFTEQRLGNFELGVLCGRGAMGDIYEARNVVSGERAAVKLLHRETLRNPGHVRRFLREARIAGSVQVPNVVRVLEVGDDDAPVPYLAMELLRGRDFAAILRKRRRLPADELVALLRQIACGIDAAHRAGVVHRDLKPQNIFCCDGEPPVWKILDFGVSRLIDGESSLTHGQAVGTPAYMAPEQARGRAADHRADLFALGVLTYRALTGRPAFTGSEVPQILYDVVHGMPPRPSELVALPRAIDDVLAIAMAKRPEDRFQSGAELVAAFDQALLGSLPDALQRRAEKLLSRRPWGRRQSDGRATGAEEAIAAPASPFDAE